MCTHHVAGDLRTTHASVHSSATKLESEPPSHAPAMSNIEKLKQNTKYHYDAHTSRRRRPPNKIRVYPQQHDLNIKGILTSSRRVQPRKKRKRVIQNTTTVCIHHILDDFQTIHVPVQCSTQSQNTASPSCATDLPPKSNTQQEKLTTSFFVFFCCLFL